MARSNWAVQFVLIDISHVFCMVQLVTTEANSSVDYALITTMKQFYRVKHSINTLNDKNNKAKRNKE